MLVFFVEVVALERVDVGDKGIGEEVEESVAREREFGVVGIDREDVGVVVAVERPLALDSPEVVDVGVEDMEEEFGGNLFR